MPQLNASELNRLYDDAESCDKEILAEMRSNQLLISGDHYKKTTSKFLQRMKETSDLSDQQKLRLVKNHISKIVDIYIHNILAHAPATTITPNNESELQDQKTAELCKSVWEYYKRNSGLRKKVREFASDYVGSGECAVKVFFDPDLGEIKGYEQMINETTGEPAFDEFNNAVPDYDKPVMTGDFVFERILPFNLLRDPEAQSMEESPYYIVRKMMPIQKVKDMCKSQEDKDAIVASSDTTFLVFDGATSNYGKEKNKVLIREHYYRPTKQYPKGYFYIATESMIIVEGELPFGIWPLRWAGFDKIPTSARARSSIKKMRPYQLEINRTASMIGQAQITLGEPKLILYNGSKISNGGSVPGVRAITVTGGGDPKVIEGASGDNYLPYMQSQITELYDVMNVKESDSARDLGQDPYTMLYHSQKNKQKFLKYGEEFEEFYISLTELFLDLAKAYLDNEALIPMIGKDEIVNIEEFKHSEPNKYRIKVEAMSDDTDTLLGRQLAINHTLQYVGANLDKEDIGRMLRAMPFVNFEESFGDFTIDHDNAKNDMLMMERGEMPTVNKFDNHKYIIKRLVHRMKQSDFKYLKPEIQQMYQVYKQGHEQLDAQELMEIQRAQQGFIPTDGYMVKADFYVTTNDGKTQRAEVPYKAMDWLIKQLAAQGSTLEQLKSMNQAALAEMSSMVTPQLPQQGQQPLQGVQNGFR